MLMAVEVSKGKPAHNFTTKVSYGIILTSFESVHDGSFDSIDRIFVHLFTLCRTLSPTRSVTVCSLKLAYH